MSQPYTLIEDLSAMVPQIPQDSILSRTFYQDEDIRAILFSFAPGQELSEHTASRPAVIHFISGKARLWLGEDEVDVRPGTWVHMPPNLTHRILAETEVNMLLYLVEGGD